MSHLVWERAAIGWQPDGYVLEVPHTLKHRSAQVFELRLALWIQDEGLELEPRLRPAAPDDGTDDVQGFVTLRSDQLFALDPAVLRDALNRVAASAVKHVDDQIEWDKTRVQEFLDVLRRRPDTR